MESWLNVASGGRPCLVRQVDPTNEHVLPYSNTCTRRQELRSFVLLNNAWLARKAVQSPLALLCTTPPFIPMSHVLAPKQLASSNILPNPILPNPTLPYPTLPYACTLAALLFCQEAAGCSFSGRAGSFAARNGQASAEPAKRPGACSDACSRGSPQRLSSEDVVRCLVRTTTAGRRARRSGCGSGTRCFQAAVTAPL